MFPWARAVVFARQRRASILAPHWVQMRLGSLLRSEPVKRFYFGEFSNADYVKGLRRWLVLARGCRVSEASVDIRGGNAARPTVVEFSGMENLFIPIRHSWELIREELFRIAAPAILERAKATSVPFIAAHVRRGDLTRQRVVADIESLTQFTPTRWFVEAIRLLREAPDWRALPIRIFSDGSDDELAPLLSIPGCQRATTGSSVGDMLALASARLLLASGYSTFSMWASFLGRMPTLYAPGKFQQPLFDAESRAFEGEWHPGSRLPVMDF
jgi:hypothetical protein